MRVLVVGDTLHDVYVTGEVNRVSPEAPVPVFDYVAEEKVLGGAANVAANIRSLCIIENLEIQYCGFISYETCKMFDEIKIQPYGTYLEPEEILEKRRLICNNHQLLRVDNKKRYHTKDCQDIARTLDQIEPNQYDLIVVSDYNKGTFSYCGMFFDLLYEDCATPIIVEEKCVRNWGSNVITKCNDKEHKKYSKGSFQLEHIITHGSRGFELTKAGKSFPVIDRPGDVVDVCGAGDVFIAGMAVSFLETGKFNPEEMAHFGNRAAGEKVRHFGTKAIKREWL